MAEYTPDTESVREQYTREQPPHIGTVAEKSAEFDRWLADRDARIMAEALMSRAELADEVQTLRDYRDSMGDRITEARAEGERAAAERIAALIWGEMKNEEMKPETPSSTGRFDGLAAAYRIARGEAS